VPIVQKISGVITAKAQCTDAIEIVHTQQIIGFMEPNRLTDSPRPLLTLQPAAHEHTPPAIRTGISEHAECIAPLRRMLRSWKESNPGIEVQTSDCGMIESPGIELELKELAAGAAAGMQDSETKWRPQPAPVRVDSDGDGHLVSAPFSIGTP
jgi:hypothetical protein